MVAEIKQAIVDKLNELYKDATIYDEFIPGDFSGGSFLISVVEETYARLIDNKGKAAITFDLAYYPVDPDNKRKECLMVQENLLRELDLPGGFRISGKTAQITDDVLHMKLTVKYREIAQAATTKMNQINLIKEV